MFVQTSLSGMRRVVLIGVALACGATAAPAAPDAAATPIPPQQTLGWTPPATTLPPVVVDAAVQLFKDGLADPRGCEYREIQIAESKDWTLKTHGWVLPGSGAQKYAIGWNGLIYPVASVGAVVNLDQEYAALPHLPGSRAFRNGTYWPGGDGVSLNLACAQPLQVAYLLRLGKAKLAEQAWAEGCNGDSDLMAKDPYAEMALLLLESWFHRAMDAFLRGDDATALALCRQISPIVEQTKAIAVSRGITDPWPERMYGSHLWQLPALQADAARRVQEKPYTPVLEMTSPPSGPERIAGLIRDLELVHAEQMMNPGEAEVADDPVVQALVKEGEPAVEPLLGVLASDDRLTRTHFTQGMGYDGPIVPVYECAYKALFRIFNVQYPLFEQDSQDPREQKDPRAMSSDDRARLAGKIAALWMKSQGMSLAEGGYLALQDDKAGPEEWFRAIDNICQPADGTRTASMIEPPQGSYSPHQGSGPFKAFGDSLHARTNPSVSALIIKRFEQLVNDRGLTFDSNKLSNMLLALADWDGKNHRADLKRLGAELDARFTLVTGAKSAEVNVTLAEKRLELGDSSALADYVSYLQALAPDQIKGAALAGSQTFSIMWHYPDDPGVRQLAEKILGKNSLIIPLPNTLVPTRLIGLPAFRRELLRGLEDKSPAGTYTAQNGGYGIAFNATGGGMGGGPAPPDAPKPGTAVDFRLCDNYAWDLAHLAGFPACELFWPEAKRDAAVAAAKALLEQYGDALKGLPADSYDDNGPVDPSLPVLLFRLAPLDHPATPDDVKAGRAIFSLAGPARVWKMPSYPLGPALQAEEMQVDGKWQRFYGLIRDGRAVQVPAAEMEFQDTLLGSVPVTKQLCAAFAGPEMSDPVFSFMYYRYNFVAAGAPLPFHITLLNHNGEDQPVPAELFLPPHAVRTLPAGLTLEVSWSPKVPPAVHRWEDPPFNYGAFTDLPARPGVTVAPPTAPGPVLEPTQTRIILQADLRDYFDLGRPGTYKVKAQFHLPNQPPSVTGETTFSITSAKS